MTQRQHANDLVSESCKVGDVYDGELFNEVSMKVADFLYGTALNIFGHRIN